MNLAELRRQVRRLVIKVRRALPGRWSGLHLSSGKGRGLAFEEVRAYVPGDSPADIDWKVTARRGEPYVKLFREERERTVWLIVDRTASMAFGSGGPTKSETALEAAAAVALAAGDQQDRVGLISFGARPSITCPRAGRRHTSRLIGELVNPTSTAGESTVLTWAAEQLRLHSKVRSLAIVISDYLGCDVEQSLQRIGRHHELVLIHVIDPAERELPNLGLVRWRDSETGRTRLVDTSYRPFRIAYSKRAADRESALRQLARSMASRYVPLLTNRPALPTLVHGLRRQTR